MLARLRASAAIVGIVLLVIGCGSSTRHAGNGTVSSSRLPSPRPLSRRAPVSLSRHALPPIGTAQAVDARGARLTVAVRQVIDPLRDSGASLPARTRAVGVIVQIRSAGPKVYDSSATGDISVVASRGAVTPVLATRGVCRTPLNDFDRYISAGEDRVGCVAFAIAAGAILEQVRFSPHAQRRGRLVWAP